MRRGLLLLLLPLLLAPAPVERFLVDEIAAVDLRLKELNDQEVEILKQADGMNTEQQLHEEERKLAEDALTQHRADALQRLGTLYRMRRRGLASVLLEADTPWDFRRRFYYMTRIVQEDRGRAEAYLAALEKLREADAKITADLEKVAKLRREVDKTRADLASQRKQRVALLAEIRGSTVLSTQHARQAEEAKKDWTPPPASPGASDFRSRRGNLPAPIRGPVLTGYGSYVDSSGQPRQNLGIDFVVPLNAPFVAVADGIVKQVRYQKGYGQIVLVEHGAYTTLYAHANGARVAQGQSVKAGDVLGLAGNTGLTDDSRGYLHFEVRYNGTPQNPEEWLAAGARTCHPDAVLCP